MNRVSVRPELDDAGSFGVSGQTGRQLLHPPAIKNLTGNWSGFLLVSSPKPPNVEPDFRRFEDIGRLWVTMPINNWK